MDVDSSPPVNILLLTEFPVHTVVGVGVIGTEYASIFGTLGVEVTLIDKRPRLLEFVDAQIAESLSYQMRNANCTLRLGEEVSSVKTEAPRRVVTSLQSGKKIITDLALVAMGRVGATEALNLAAQVSKRMRAAASWSTRHSRPSKSTSKRWEMSSDSRRWPRLRWSRGGWRLLRLRRGVTAITRSLPVRDLLRSRDLHGRKERRGADGGRGAIRGRRGALTGDRRGAILGDYRVLKSSSTPRPARSWACTSSARRRPSWCTSARRSWPFGGMLDYFRLYGRTTRLCRVLQGGRPGRIQQGRPSAGETPPSEAVARFGEFLSVP